MTYFPQRYHTRQGKDKPRSTGKWSDAYDMGARAGANGESSASCPYPPGTNAASAYWFGYTENSAGLACQAFVSRQRCEKRTL